MPLRPHLPGASSRPASSDVEQLGDVMVGDRHALGDTGGARGVDDVGDVIGGRRRQCGAGLGVNSGVVDIDDQQIAPVQPVGQPVVVIAAIGAASASMNSIRAAGSAGSIGR